MRRAVFVLSAVVALWLAPGALAAGWCGTGEAATDSPDITTGRQIHAIAVLPADSADTFASVAAKLADDTASITSWWAGQDPTRVPRFDLARFSTGDCLDVSFVRLPDAGATYRGGSGSFDRMVGQLETAGFTNAYKRYYVYYDGPSVQTNVCGTGGGSFSGGPAFAFVWLNGCPGVPTDSVGAHELLHSLGALPFGAPHACPGDSGHPCDSTTDLLYPYTTGQPLSASVLDFNHDDYYGHSGSWNDLQDSLWLHRLDLPQVALSVTMSGTGTVVSDVPGLDCVTSCTTQWDSGSVVALSAEPDAGMRLVRWTGACVGNTDCALDLTQPVSATAVFGPVLIPLKVATAGKGKIVCSPACTKTFTGGALLTLRAAATKGWRFTGWSGGCKGKRLICTPSTDFALSVKATFRRK
jgi:hypothetical protein